MHIHISTLQILFPYRSLQSIEQSSVCYTVSSYQLCILYIACVCACSVTQLGPTLLQVCSSLVSFGEEILMRFPRQECRSWLPFPLPGDLPNLGIEPVSPASAGRSFATVPPGKPMQQCLSPLICNFFSRMFMKITGQMFCRLSYDLVSSDIF